MTRGLRRVLLGIAAAAVCLTASLTASAQGADPLAGKTLRFIIGANAGGSSDNYARIFIDQLRPLFPNTTMVAQNLPGADGQFAIVEAAASGPNAVTLVFIQPGPIYDQLRQSTAPAIDLATFHPIGALASNQRLVIVRTSLGATNFDEVVALGLRLKTPTTSAVAANHVESVLIDAVTPLELDVIAGVDDQVRNPMFIAGELDAIVTSYFNVRTLFESGHMVAVLRTGETGYPPEFASLPSLADVALPGTPPEVIEIMDTLNALGRLLIAAPNTDPAAVEALRVGFDEVVAAPALAAEYDRLGLSFGPMSGHELEARMVTLLADRHAGDIFRAYLACGAEGAVGPAAVQCASR